MKRYIKSSIEIKERNKHGYEFSLEPTGESVSFAYWGRSYEDLPIYKDQKSGLWVKFKDGNELSWHKLKHGLEDKLIPSNTVALELDDWEKWNEKMLSKNAWWY